MKKRLRKRAWWRSYPEEMRRIAFVPKEMPPKAVKVKDRMPKFTRTSEPGVILFFCPGCNTGHRLPVGKSINTAPVVWEWNESLDLPTVSPSIRVAQQYWTMGGETMQWDVCHSFVRDGKIEFLSDCTHELAGQTVELPEWEGS